MSIEKIIPKDGPSIYEVEKYIKKYSNELIVVKAGGSVLLDENLFNQFIEDITVINKLTLNKKRHFKLIKCLLGLITSQPYI